MVGGVLPHHSSRRGGRLYLAHGALRAVLGGIDRDCLHKGPMALEAAVAISAFDHAAEPAAKAAPRGISKRASLSAGRGTHQWRLSGLDDYPGLTLQ